MNGLVEQPNRTIADAVRAKLTRQKLDARTFLGYFLKFASTTCIIVYYNPATNKIGRSAHVYFDELNVGLKTDHKPKFGKALIENYPSTPDPTKFEISTIQTQELPILQHPITTYKLLLPIINETTSIKFYDDTTFGIPYIRSIPASSFIGKQLPKQSLTQQYLISLENEEPIHASSAQEEFQRLRKTHATQFITIQLSKRDPTPPAQYKELRTKFDQLRPVIATTSKSDNSTIDPTGIYTHLNTPTVAILTHLPTKPIAHKNVMECFHPTNPHYAQ